MNILEQFKNGGLIRKMQTAAGGPIKKPIKRLKDGYRYIPDEENGGWDRISDNSMSDVFATMEFTPKKTNVGSSITRKQSAPSKTYYSAYNPDDVVKGFNALTLGGLNNLSPTQWVRRYIDLNQLLVSQIPGSKRTMTWSGFVNNWLNGNNGLVSGKFAQEHPYWSMGINGVGDAVALGGLANANTVKLVGNIAAKHGGDAAKITIDVAKNSSKPFNLKNYKFLGDSRFYSDLDDVGYKTLMSERLSGNYPLTFAERKNYITGLKNDIQKGVDYAINEAKANLKAPLKSGKVNEYTSTNGSKSLRFDPYSPEDILPQQIHYGTLRATKEYGQTPWEGNYGAFLDENVGLFFPFRNKPNTLRTHSMFQDVGERVSTGAHETRHTIQKYFDTPLVERRYDLPGTYGRYTNRKLPLDFKKKVNEFVNDALTAGEWEGSLAEMDSELTGWSAKYGFPRYSQMNPKQKALLYDMFHRRFGGNTDYSENAFHLLRNDKTLNPFAILREVKGIDNSKIGQILQGLEELGYRKQGGKMNVLKLFKNGGQIRKMQTAAGGPINYKRWDNAKITSYTIPYIKEKTIKLTNAGKATGAKLSTNLLDSLADNAYRAGLPIRKGLGIAFKESTFGNPTDDKSAWNLSSKIRELFNNKYPGTYLHINNGRTVIGQHLINYHKGDVNHEIFYKGNPDSHKSIILEAFEFYKQHPDKYNQGLKNYQQLIDERGNEAMQSPEILKWYRGWEKSKAQIFKPEPYKINTNIQDTVLEFVPYKKEGGKMNAIEQFKQGSKIHIKKENRGKFTNYCGGNVTSSCIARAKASGNKTLIKRAVFALNARKWKHQMGGSITPWGETRWVRHKTFDEFDSAGNKLYKGHNDDYSYLKDMGINISLDDYLKQLSNEIEIKQPGGSFNVDTRSDTTRRGYHEGLPAYGAANASNTAGLWDLMNYNVVKGPVITGEPVLLPGRLSIRTVKPVKLFNPINSEAEALAAKDWLITQGYKYEDLIPKNPISTPKNPVKPLIKKKITNAKLTQSERYKDRKTFTKAQREKDKSARAMETEKGSPVRSGNYRMTRALNEYDFDFMDKFPYFRDVRKKLLIRKSKWESSGNTQAKKLWLQDYKNALQEFRDFYRKK